MSEEGLAVLIASKVPWREELHGRLAVEVAKSAKIFLDDDSDSVPSWLAEITAGEVGGDSVASGARFVLPASGIQPVVLGIQNANEDNIRSFLSWKEQMAWDVHDQNPGVNTTTNSEATCSQNTMAADHGRVGQLFVNQSPGSDNGAPTVWHIDESNQLSEAALAPVDPSMLQYDQFRAYDIIVWHLDQTLVGRNPPPLQMLIHGEGGTGKSKVIQTITEYFTSKGSRPTLLKAAYTGVAASLIDGKTTHSITMISWSDDIPTSQTRGKLQAFWKHIRYLVIDEMSMIAKSFLAKLSRNIGVGKMVEGQPVSNHSFSGISVIMCGDFHQFPPVAVSPREALYYDCKPHDPASSQLGRAIYEEFNTIVILKEQMRVTDEVWHDFLQHLRYGRVQQHHIDMLHTLLIVKPEACCESKCGFGSE